MDLLHATIEEFAAEGYTHVECFCPRCRMIRLRPMSWLPKISMGLTLDQLAQRLRCAECGGPLLSVKPWCQADVLGRPEGRRECLVAIGSTPLALILTYSKVFRFRCLS